MLPRERVEAALRHEEPDLVPWGEHSIDYNIYEMVLGRRSYVQGKIRETKALWNGQRDEVVESYRRDVIDLADVLGMEIITAKPVPPVGYAPTPLEPVDDQTYRDGAGNLWRVSSATEQLMPYWTDVSGYRVPSVESIHEQIDAVDRNGVARPDESCYEVIRHIVAERKATHWINLCTGGMGFPMVGPTTEEQCVNAVLHPELLGPVAELQAKHCMAELPWYVELGIDSVMPCHDLGSSTALFANPRILKEHVLPWWIEYVKCAHGLGLKVIQHCCGCITEALPFVVEAGYDGWEAVQASAGMDLRVIKQQYGDRLTLWSGIWNEHLILGTPDDIETDARYAIQWAAPGGGYIYGATHSLAMGTRPENLQRMKEARERYGVYPIDTTGGA